MGKYKKEHRTVHLSGVGQNAAAPYLYLPKVCHEVKEV